MRRLTGAALAVGLAMLGVPALAGSGWSGSGGPAAPTSSTSKAPAAPALPPSTSGHANAVFVHAATTDDARAAAERAGLRVFDSFDRIGVAAAAGPAAAIEAARADPAVTQVEENSPVELYMETSHDATRGREARTAFRQIMQPSRSTEAWRARVDHGPGPAFAGEIDGRGVTVAVIDTGVDGNHPMFVRDGTSKVRRNMKLACFSNPPGLSFGGGLPENTCPDEPHPFWLDMTNRGNDTDTPSLGGHGTHVAGIVAGYDVEVDDETALHGAAPGAQLVSLSMGSAVAVYGGAAAMNWVLHNHRNPCDGCPPIRVINNSWGGSGEHNPDSVIAKLQNELVKEGVVVVWAAGNSGGDGSQTNLNRDAQSATPGVLAVANYSDGDSGTREGSLDETSSRGERANPGTYPDLSAPGTDIASACRPHLTLCTQGSNYGTISGTSMAAPHVAGIVAQLMQARPPITPAQVEDVVEDTAHRFGAGEPYEPDDPARNDGRTSLDKGHGLVDATAAIAAVLGVGDPAVAAECRSHAPIVTDAEGDTGLGGLPGPSEPALDIGGGRIDERGHLTFVTDVGDLGDGSPSGSDGIAFDWSFTRGGGEEEWTLRSMRAASGQTHSLVVTPDQGDEKTIEGLTGTFDTERDEVRISVPPSALAAAGITPPRHGEVLSDFGLISWRREGVVLVRVDNAVGSHCVHVVGTGTSTDPVRDIEPLPQPRAEDADATLRDEESFEDEGTPPGSTEAYECKRPYDPRCVTYVLDLRPSGGQGALDIAVETDVIGTVAEDFDVYVYDTTGRRLGGADQPQTLRESALVGIPEPGFYFLVVQPYTATNESPYTVTATLRQ